MLRQKISRLTPVLLLALMSCATSPDGLPTDTPLDIGGVATQASGYYDVITAADRAAHQPSPLVSQFIVVHHFASMAPLPIGATTGTGGGTSGVTTFVGSSAGFNGPVALAVDGSGNVYVADTANDCIRKIDTQG